ncbi:MAG TPA: quinone oxidoreductase [Acidimicrobiia bacterium]|nr:quinone oxidoreductase [Acidimicrobiia bacterium]
MKAIVIPEAGGPEVLSYQELADPTPGPGELLVDVAAAGLNFIDTYHRIGLYPMEFPIVPGQEGAGTVVALGDGVTEFSIGDQVAWAEGLGSYAELNTVTAARAVPVLPGVGLDVAAGVILQGMTAHYLATDTFPLGDGDTCLIHAGAGGVGLLLTQIAARAGARVITTVGSEDKAELSRAAGAGDVIVYTSTDFKEAVEDLVGPHALDVVYDGVGAATFDRSIDLLRPRGMMVTFGNASGPVPEIQPLLLARKGSIFLTRPTLAHYVPTREDLLGRAGDLFAWVDSGDLDVRIGARYPLEEAAEAHRALESRRTTGKVLLIP